VQAISPTPIRPFALSTGGICKLFGQTVALWQVDLVMSSGELVVVQGPNGSGKSTLLRIVAGLSTPTRGRVRWMRDADGRSPRVAYMGHPTHLYPALSPGENILLAARLGHCAPEAGLAAFDRLDIAHVAARPCRELSSGTLRRVALARAIATQPDVLVVDEPFAGVDGAAAELVGAVLSAAKHEGRAVLVATHDDARVRSLADISVGLDGAGW